MYHQEPQKISKNASSKNHGFDMFFDVLIDLPAHSFPRNVCLINTTSAICLCVFTTLLVPAFHE